VVLPVGEIGEVIIADCFRQIFAGGGISKFQILHARQNVV
jgi:hypothetical protein